VRGLVQMTAEKGADRRPLTGSADQIRDDIEMLERKGVTEVFLDLNFDPEVGSPLADPRASIERAHHVLDAFAPGLDR
jgi:hypothetical protein